jgi:hypothetical protein
MTLGPGDARLGRPEASRGERRVRPRHQDIWIHVRGRWRKGRITSWITIPELLGWECEVEADRSPGEPRWQGRYEYDGRTIRPRYGNDPPNGPGRRRWLGPLGTHERRPLLGML